MVMTDVMLFVRTPFMRVVGIRSSAGLTACTKEEDDDDGER